MNFNSIFKKFYIYKHSILVISIIIFHTILNYIWTFLNNTPFQERPAVNLLGVIKWWDSLKISNIFNWLGKEDPPPLIRYLAAILYIFFKNNLPKFIILSNIPFMAILFFSIYQIGKKMHSKNVGLLSVLIISTLPIVFILSRLFYPEFPLAAMVTLSIYLLIQSRYFENKKYSLLFGLSFGLGVLTGGTYPLFVIGPLIYMLWKSRVMNDLKKDYPNIIKCIISGVLLYLLLSLLFPNISKMISYNLIRFRAKPYYDNVILIYYSISLILFLYFVQKETHLANFINSLLIGINIGIIWLLMNLDFFIWRLNLTKKFCGSIFNFNSSSHYMIGFTIIGMSLLYFFIFCFALIYIELQRIKKENIHYEELYLLLWWLAPPLIFFSLFFEPQPRYILPVFPALVLIMAIVIFSIKRKKVRETTIVLTIIVGFLVLLVPKDIYNNLGYKEYNICLIRKINSIVINPKMNLIYGSSVFYDEGRYPGMDWKIGKMVDFINRDNMNKIDLGVLIDHWFLYSLSFKVELWRKGINKINIIDVVYADTPISNISIIDAYQQISHCDYVIIKEKDYLRFSRPLPKGLEKLLLYVKQMSKSGLVKEAMAYNLPDGSRAVIYKKVK